MNTHAVQKKRLALIVGTAIALCQSAAALAAVGGTTEDGWAFSIDGNVNAFLVYEDSDALPAGVSGGTLSDDAQATRIRTGLLPAAIGFNIETPLENGLKGGARVGFYPQIQNARTKNQFGSQIDLREAFATVEGGFGELLAGRALSLFLRQNILTDMTLHGVGVQGGVAGGGTTLGRIGYGYVYPQFNAQMRYTTPDMGGFTAAVGLFDPSQIGNAGAVQFAEATDMPRLEFEILGDDVAGTGISAWLNGMYQEAEFAATGETVEANGIGAGLQWTGGGLSLMASAYSGQALGTTLMLDVDALSPTGVERDHQGFITQATYTLGATKYGISYGESSADQATGDTAAELDTQSSLTLGVYHDFTSWFKVVGEVTQAENEWFDGNSQDSNIFTVGTFFSW